VITSVQHRRRWSRAEKKRIIAATIEPTRPRPARVVDAGDREAAMRYVTTQSRIEVQEHATELAYRKRRALFLWGVIVVGLLLAARYTTAANAQGHVRPGLPNPPGDCGIVVHEKSRNPVARMPDGRVVMLKDKEKVVFHRADAGHLHACWNEPERGGSR